MKENIWGKNGCELPNGGLCNACCVLPNIELEGTYVSLSKPAHSPCPYLGQYQGCSLHFGSKPPQCVSWHCSQSDNQAKVDMIAQGLAMGLVTPDEASLSTEKLLPGTLNEVSIQIRKRAQFLKTITANQDLIVRDVTET